MTLAERIRVEAESLSPKEQRALLTIARSLRGKLGMAKSKDVKPIRKAARKTLGQARAAMRAVQGLWKDRTDLPADTVEASLELRQRLMRRGANG